VFVVDCKYSCASGLVVSRSSSLIARDSPRISESVKRCKKQPIGISCDLFPVCLSRTKEPADQSSVNGFVEHRLNHARICNAYRFAQLAYVFSKQLICNRRSQRRCSGSAVQLGKAYAPIPFRLPQCFAPFSILDVTITQSYAVGKRQHCLVDLWEHA
jgi:hypothetical protein